MVWPGSKLAARTAGLVVASAWRAVALTTTFTRPACTTIWDTRLEDLFAHAEHASAHSPHYRDDHMQGMADALGEPVCA